MTKIDIKKGYVTPKGTAVWPALNTPDEFRGSSHYRCDVRVSSEEAEKMLTFFQPMLDEYAASEKADSLNPLPIQREADKDGTLLDTWLIRVKMNSSYKSRQGVVVPLHPKLYDSQQVLLPKTLPIGGGSTVRVSFTVYPYAMAEKVINNGKQQTRKVAGLSFRLQGVQVLALVEAGGSVGSEIFNKEDGFQLEGAEFSTGGDY
jgi:hypothetical protein